MPPTRDLPPSRDHRPRDPQSREPQSRDRDQHKDDRGSASPNIQDAFLNVARREKLAVAIRLLDGETLEGRIKNFDRFALIIDHAGTDHLVFKHAIATIKSPRSVGSYYASHDPH